MTLGASTLRIGWLGGALPLARDLERRAVVLPVEADALDRVGVGLWVAHTPDLPPARLRQLRALDVPVLFLVAPEAAVSWHRVIGKGVHDVAWLPSSPAEVVGRARGLLTRREAWTLAAGRVCRELAHDVRSPLHAITLTAGSLRQELGDRPDLAEDLDAVLEAADVVDLLLDGARNLGRGPDGSTGTADLLAVAQRVGRRSALRERVRVAPGPALPVPLSSTALEDLVADLVRVAWSRLAARSWADVVGRLQPGRAELAVHAPVYPRLLDHLPALFERGGAARARREGVPMPATGLAWARDTAVRHGGSLRAFGSAADVLTLELTLPLARPGDAP